MKKTKVQRIDTFFRKKDEGGPSANDKSNLVNDPDIIEQHVRNVVDSGEQETSKRARTEGPNINSIDYNPANCAQIWEYPLDQRDKVRRAYISEGPCHPDSKVCFPAFRSPWTSTMM